MFLGTYSVTFNIVIMYLIAQLLHDTKHFYSNAEEITLLKIAE